MKKKNKKDNNNKSKTDNKKNNYNNITSIEQMIYTIKIILKYYNRMSGYSKGYLTKEYVRKKRKIIKNSTNKEDKKDCKKKEENVENKDKEKNDIELIENLKQDDINRDDKVINIPIIVAEKYIDIPIQEKIQLDNLAFEINEIKNDIYLTNYKVIPNKIESENTCTEGKVFIKGNIENKIQYSTVQKINSNSVSGEIKYKVVYIPFGCTSFINFQMPLTVNFQSEFTEAIKCNMKSAEVFGSNLYEVENELISHSFKSFNEKIILRLHLIFIQEKKVSINGLL
ncbi:hypothetical protein [Clostridium botulinum]|uniref:DUF7852 domain-containing protein n=2 Tax=Clostridium botulinum TaxID=1491 RepID=A0A9Q1ZD37_CLOBO|nr:hypothetical protein [Clostridium botulinum]AEB75571.1 hypothetical protein CbC4_0891 [Clostridium botulinum BKT015925]KEI04300.1 hypothetical protein Y848_02045 [Clostridium botulinum C/D str. Sp77]KLU75254.1 hypothetical protein CBC3_09680 [Clostridium botulinum V891]KOA76468.1 hypothetical protein ADU77_09010 [Clostridium botulinum]KOA78470.1 hypothetical protein ADU78_01720 [Clostridium botulinum]